MTTTVRSINVDLSNDEVRYMLHALSQFKKSCHEKLAADEDGDLTYMYANDIMETRLIYEKLEKLAVPEFGEDVLKFSYDVL